jgi:hypothetical protein
MVTPTSVVPTPEVAAALPVGVSTMERTYEGEIAGRSSCVFTAAFDQSTGVGTYVAMDSFEGTLNGRSGAFVFVHSAATRGNDRDNGFFRIVESSGAGALAGITGEGGMEIETDGTHRIWFDYELG